MDTADGEQDRTGEVTKGSGPVVRPDRSTAPMSEYSMRDVAIGIAVLTAGVVVTVAIPVLAGL